MRKFCFIVFISLVNFGLFSQDFLRPHEWKKYRHEVFITSGFSQFLGDLGGSGKNNGIAVHQGVNYSFKDMNWSATRSTFGAGYRYKLKPHINLVGNFQYVKVTGDDELTNDKYRHDRHLNFKSDIY